MATPEAKPAITSRTIVASVLLLIAGAASAAGVDLGLTPEVQTAIIAVGAPLVAILLRLDTNAPIKGSWKDER